MFSSDLYLWGVAYRLMGTAAKIQYLQKLIPYCHVCRKRNKMQENQVWTFFSIEVSLLRFFVFYVELCFNQIEIPADLGSI